ncbi:MAG: TlpA disulfide reductase family protein [Planctomycetota bacterium]|nr:TlpA disulfide reductase family protein [Planctomycetota bacterium]
MVVARNWLAGIATLLAAIICGCGDDSAPSGSAGSAATPPNASPIDSGQTSTPGAFPAASISGNSASSSVSDSLEVDRAQNQRETSTAPEKGSPRWLVLQMTQLRMKPFPETDDIEKQRESRRVRNQEIITLATEAIARTHEDKEQEAVFNVAVHRLMDATMELALQGDQESVDALFGHADSLYQRDPKSRAAAEAAWFVARFANTNARRFADQDIRWLQEFSRQTRTFADRFPGEQQRAVGLLSDAGASCDYHGLREEAILCFETLKQNYPDTPQAEQAIPALRRLNLIGKPLDLGGPTLDGGFISVADFKGSPVLVVFWSTQASPFIEQADSIIVAAAKYESQGLQVLGVNLDIDETAIDAFLEKSRMGWRTIFHTDADRRGWKHPIAVYYGVTDIPQIWLVDAAGKVVSTTIAARDLDATLARLLPAARPVTATTPR